MRRRLSLVLALAVCLAAVGCAQAVSSRSTAREVGMAAPTPLGHSQAERPSYLIYDPP